MLTIPVTNGDGVKIGELTLRPEALAGIADCAAAGLPNPELMPWLYRHDAASKWTVWSVTIRNQPVPAQDVTKQGGGA